jgi:hypothetical protein
MALDSGAGPDATTAELSRADMTALRRLVVKAELPTDPAWLRAVPVAMDTMWRRAQIMLFVLVPVLVVGAFYEMYQVSHGGHHARLGTVVLVVLAATFFSTAVRIFRAVTTLRQRLGAES